MVFKGNKFTHRTVGVFVETLYWNEGTQRLFRRESYAQTPFFKVFGTTNYYQLKQTILHNKKYFWNLSFNLAPPLPKRIYICYNGIVKMVSSYNGKQLKCFLG